MPEPFPLFIVLLQTLPYLLYSPSSAACSFAAPLSPSLSPLLLKYCIYILLRCGSPSQSCSTATLRRRLLPSLQLLFVSPQSGGLSRFIYNAARVGQIFTLTLCAWVHPACREARKGGRERKRQNISDRTTADSEGEKKGSWKTVSTGGRRGGGWAASLIRHHKHHSTFSFFFKNGGKTKGLRNVLERHSVDLTLCEAWRLFRSGTWTVHLHLAMSVLKWTKHRKRSSDSIYDMLHLVSFLPCTPFFFILLLLLLW